MMLIARIELEHDGPEISYGAAMIPLARAIERVIPFDIEIRTLNGVSTFHPVRVTIEEAPQ